MISPLMFLRSLSRYADAYGEDVLFIAFMWFLLPFLQAFLILREVLPVFILCFAACCYMLALLEIPLLVAFYRHRCANGAATRSRLLAVLAFIRAPFWIAGAMSVPFIPHWISLPLILPWFFANWFFMGLFLGQLEDELPPLQMSPRRLIATRAFLFLHMCAMTTVGYTIIHKIGSVSDRQFFSDLGEAIAFLALLLLIYIPSRLYEFLGGLPQKAEKKKFGSFLLRQTLVFVLIALETGTSNPAVLKTALRIESASTDLTSLDLKNSDLDEMELVGEFTNLEHLSLASNGLTEVPPAILKLPKLVSLDLSNNAITKLPPEIGQMKILEYLNVSDNRLQALPVTLVRRVKQLTAKRNPLDELDVSVERNFHSRNDWTR